MYYYAPDNNRTGRRAGLIAAACYLAAFLAVSLLVSVSYTHLTLPTTERV